MGLDCWILGPELLSFELLGSLASFESGAQG